MDITMTEISNLVRETCEKTGLDFTIDNRVECLAALAKEIVEWDEVNPNTRTRISLEITVEIVRLRVEKAMFEK